MSKEDKKAAKKQAKLNKKEDSYKEKIDQLEDRVKRQMAESRTSAREPIKRNRQCSIPVQECDREDPSGSR